MARLTDMPNEILNIILMFYFKGQMVRYCRQLSLPGSPLPNQSKLLAMLSVCKSLLNRRQVIDMMLKHATLRVTCINDLAQLRSIDDSQKALIQQLQTWDNEPNNIELPYAFCCTYEYTYHLLSNLRLVTIKVWQITLEVDNRSKLFRKSQHSTTPLPLYKHDPECPSTIHLNHNPMDSDTSIYDLSELELDLRRGVRYGSGEDPVQFACCVNYRLFRYFPWSDKFLPQAPDKGAEIVFEDIEILVSPHWEDHCECLIVFKVGGLSRIDLCSQTNDCFRMPGLVPET